MDPTLISTIIAAVLLVVSEILPFLPNSWPKGIIQAVFQGIVMAAKQCGVVAVLPPIPSTIPTINAPPIPSPSPISQQSPPHS